MAKKKPKKNAKRAKAMRSFWRRRKAAGKAGGLGRTKRPKARRAPRKKMANKRRARAMRSHWRRRKAAGKGGALGRTRRPKTRRLRRTPTRMTGSRTRRTRMTSRIRRAHRSYRARQRTRRLGPNDLALISRAERRTVKVNPGRRRRRRSRARSGRRYSARRRRRSHGRRGYRRNPGNQIMDLVKKTLPVLGSYLFSRLIVNKVGPMIPGLSSLGAAQNPAVSAVVAVAANFATRRVGALARHRDSIMTGAVMNVIASAIQAFLPASALATIGMGDYVQMGDYIAVGATPIDDSMTLSDYVAVGGDGVEEELGLEEELGAVEEELGNDLLGGMPGGASLLKQVPTQAFIAPIPARSFSKVIPPAGTNYDNPGQLYNGIFNGGFGR